MTNFINSDIFLASDHKGLELKNFILKYLIDKKRKIKDVGPYSLDVNDDYPDYAYKVSLNVSKNNLNNSKCGILICHTGVGMLISANRFINIRAVLACNKFCVEMSRVHNNSNILVIPSAFILSIISIDLIEIWLNTNFSAQERHVRRLEKVETYAKKMK